jgi:hypothetical protein
MVVVRDAKLDHHGPMLSYTRDEWRAFIDGVKAGEFDAFAATDTVDDLDPARPPV